MGSVLRVNSPSSLTSSTSKFGAVPPSARVTNLGSWAAGSRYISPITLFPSVGCRYSFIMRWVAVPLMSAVAFPSSEKSSAHSMVRP